jgi:hypothetical protein
MNTQWLRFLLGFMFLFSVAEAGDKKGKNLIITFHLETDQNNNPKMIFQQHVAGKLRYFQRTPEVSSKDIVSFSPFLADNEKDYGVVFKLRASAASRLETMTTANQGKLLCSAVNGRVVDVVRIDKPVSDGYIVIWNGVTGEELKEYDKLAPRIGKEKK